MIESKINKILRKHFIIHSSSESEQCVDEIMKLMVIECAVARNESYEYWRKSVDRIRELKSIIKQARANCFSNKPHKTIIEILDRGIDGRSS